MKVEWADFFSLLRCLNCGEGLDHKGDCERYSQHPDITGELKCASCGKSLPTSF